MQNQPDISRFPVPELSEMPDDIRTRIVAFRRSLVSCQTCSLFSLIGQTSSGPSLPIMLANRSPSAAAVAINADCSD